MKQLIKKQFNRLKRKKRVRKHISGTNIKPRLTVYRSGLHIYAQLIDDQSQATLAAASDIKIAKGTKTQKAIEVGKNVALAATKLKITEAVFDRNGYKYHGRIKALADSARQNGLKF